MIKLSGCIEMLFAEIEEFSERIPACAEAGLDAIEFWGYSNKDVDAIAANLRYFAGSNVTGVKIQGAYNSSGSERELMRSWVFAKLLWDPSRDLWQLMQDFIWGYYGKAAPALVEYNALLRQMGQEHEEVLKSRASISRNWEAIWRDFLDQSAAIFDRAEELAAEDGAILQRVELARLPIAYVELRRLAGYEDTNDAERLAVDPAMRAVVGRRSEKPAASTNTLSRFETQILSEPNNLEKLTKLNSAWVARAGK